MVRYKLLDKQREFIEIPHSNSLDVAIRYAADNGADVINMSLGAYAENFTDGFGDAQEGDSSVATALTTAINYAHSKDCVVVAAAGNELTYRKSYPACNSGVIGVGALAEKSGTKAADFSNYNSSSDTSTGNNNVDVMAPGVVYTAQVPQKAALEGEPRHLPPRQRQFARGDQERRHLYGDETTQN